MSFGVLATPWVYHIRLLPKRLRGRSPRSWRNHTVDDDETKHRFGIAVGSPLKVASASREDHSTLGLSANPASATPAPRGSRRPRGQSRSRRRSQGSRSKRHCRLNRQSRTNRSSRSKVSCRSSRWKTCWQSTRWSGSRRSNRWSDTSQESSPNPACSSGASSVSTGCGGATSSMPPAYERPRGGRSPWHVGHPDPIDLASGDGGPVAAASQGGDTLWRGSRLRAQLDGLRRVTTWRGARTVAAGRPTTTTLVL